MNDIERVDNTNALAFVNVTVTYLASKSSINEVFESIESDVENSFSIFILSITNTPYALTARDSYALTARAGTASALAMIH